jgi:hypothetical protein
VSKKKQQDPLVEALKAGRSFTVTLPEGGAFHSMRMILKHGQSLTFSPVTNYHDVEIGDIVLAKWRGGGYISHLVGEIQSDQFLIVNSIGKTNGWVHGSDILGRVTETTEPELHPSVPEMMDQLESAYRELIQHKLPTQDDVTRLLSIVDDMRWYVGNIGPEKWTRMPKSSSKWSFEQHLWHLLKQTRNAADAGWPESIIQLINHGKEHIGQIAEALSLPEMGETQ